MADLSNVDFSRVADMPTDWYPVKIVADRLNSDRKGEQYLTLQLTILEGKYRNRRVFDDLRLWSQNDQCRNICMARLKNAAKAIKHPNPNNIRNSSELLGGELLAKIIYNAEWDRPEVRGYKPLAGQSTPAPQAAPTAPAAPAAPTQPQSAPQPAPQPQPQQEAPSEDVRAPWER